MIDAHYEKGLQLIQSGSLVEGLQHLDAFLKQNPIHGRCWNDAGIALFRLGRTEEAIQYFLRSVDLPDHPPQAYHNLIEGYLSLNKTASAVHWLKSACLEGQLDEAVFSKIAGQFEQGSDVASAMDALFRGKVHCDTVRILDQHIEALKSKRAKIAFFCGADGPSFLNEIVEYARQRYQVRIFEGSTAQDVYDLMQWSDISWFEWCTELARIGTNLPKVCRNIIRLHRYEAYLSWPTLINWANTDLMITVGNSWVIDAMNRWGKDIHKIVKLITIPNGLDVNKFSFKKRSPGKKIAFVAALRTVKNPMLLVQCMACLLKQDPTYKLHMAGNLKEILLCQYLEHSTRAMGISDSFVFEGFQSDIKSWLADKNYIVSTSVIESQGMGIMEAMSMGIKPVIHNYPGAEEVFGNSWLFNTPQEFCRQILESPYDSEQYRGFVEQRYPLDRQLFRINEIFAGFEQNLVKTNAFNARVPVAAGEFSSFPTSV